MSDQMTYNCDGIEHYAWCEVCGMPCMVDEHVVVDGAINVNGRTWLIHKHASCCDERDDS